MALKTNIVSKKKNSVLKKILTIATAFVAIGIDAVAPTTSMTFATDSANAAQSVGT